MAEESIWCDNGFHSRLSLSSDQAKIVAAFNASMMPVTLTVNVLLLVSLVRTKQHRSVSNRFMCVLCMSDILVGGLVQVVVSLLFTTYKDTSVCKFEVASTFVTFLFGHFSGFLVVAVSIDRAIHMKFLYSYSRIMTKRRGKVIIGLCFSVAVMFATAYVLASFFKVYAFVNSGILIADALAVSIVFVTYMLVYWSVKRHVKQSAHLRVDGMSQSSEKLDISKIGKKPKYALAMAKTIFCILTAVFIAYIPYVCVSLARSFTVAIKKEVPSSHLEFAMYLTYVLVYLNSSLNAFIFLFGNSRCRNWVMQPLIDYGIISSKLEEELSTPEQTGSAV